MIPLDRVRELLAAATPGPWGHYYDEDAGRPCVSCATPTGELCTYLVAEVCSDMVEDAALIAAAPDLARDVLSLADALATAERERDEAREIAVALGEVTERQGRMLARAPTFEDAVALCIEAIVSTAADAPNCAEWRGTMGVREFVLSLQWADGKSPHALLSEARAERDTARSALDGLVAAVRVEREARIAVVERVARCEVVRDSHECVSGMAHDRLHEARALHDKATAHLGALLSAAPPRTTVDVRVVREYLAAVDGYTDCRGVLSDVTAARTALDAALAGCV